VPKDVYVPNQDDMRK